MGTRTLKTLFALSLAALVAVPAAGQVGSAPFSAFPTEDETDGRFMGFGCAGLATLEQTISLGVAIPFGEPSFTLSVFDGDTGGVDGEGVGHWDLGSRQLLFELYADPLRQGSTDPADLISTWTGNDPNPTSGPGWTATAAAMPDNDWWGVTVVPDTSAQAPSGNYFYNLRIRTDGACNPGERMESSLKVATNQPLGFLVPTFGLVGAMRTFADLEILYPGIPMPPASFVDEPTTYDGTFTFFLDVPPGEVELSLYDGDFDYGTRGLTAIPSGLVLEPCADDDDAETHADYQGFPFAVTGARAEGGGNTPSPADDNVLDAFRRGESGAAGGTGCVRYQVTDPNGTVHRNDNPSAGEEWEHFRIAAQAAFTPGLADVSMASDTVPAGIWRVDVVGLDLANLNFWYAESACANTGTGADIQPACPRENRFLLGDTVWLDLDGDGVQDPGEGGIAGVTVEIVDGSGTVLGTSVTGDATQDNWSACVASNTGLDTDGLYCFGVDDPGTYTVRVVGSGFDPGAPLEGLVSTTGGETQTDGLVDDNVLTYDFGYTAFGSIGDRVWLDSDADGVQDAGEPGIEGVTVELLDADGDVVATTVTGADGAYLFEGLPPGTYTVRVDVTTVPADYTQTFDLDGLLTRHEATGTLAFAEDRRDFDFGYAPCGACEGKVSRLTLQYNGATAVRITVRSNRGGNTEEVIFDATVAPGEVFELVGPSTGRPGFAGTLGTEIDVLFDGVLHTSIHTSCSVEIGPGSVFGDLLVLAGASSGGGALCPIDGCGFCDGSGSTSPSGSTDPTAPFAPTDPTSGDAGVATVGYWKNHPEAWPVSSLTVGGETLSRADALEVLNAPVRSDSDLALAQQLIAAELNVAAGAETSCIAATLATAHAHLASGSADRGEAVRLAEELTRYNEGELCASSRG